VKKENVYLSSIKEDQRRDVSTVPGLKNHCTREAGPLTHRRSSNVSIITGWGKA